MHVESLLMLVAAAAYASRAFVLQHDKLRSPRCSVCDGPAPAFTTHDGTFKLQLDQLLYLAFVLKHQPELLKMTW